MLIRELPYIVRSQSHKIDLYLDFYGLIYALLPHNSDQEHNNYFQMAPEKRLKLAVEGPDLITRARQVVNKVSHGCQLEGGFGGFSVSVYDTAWVSMVTKKDSLGVRQWVFPEAFAYILRQQHEDGSWGTDASPVNLILDTMAGLLSLLEHRAVNIAEDRVGEDRDNVDYQWRVSHATTTLSKALSSWDVRSTVHVGFEILVPCLLDQLAQRDVNLEFPAKAQLMQLYQDKLSKFRPEMVTSRQQTTLLHSLEGLIGKVDFQNLKHHCTVYGGMMGSPASTAAYLLYSPVWDEAAEQYLRNVLKRPESGGGAPSGFPTPIFESSWTISTLLASGYTIDDFPTDDTQNITIYLQQAFETQHGLLGFALGFVPDADDTARSLLALSQLGVQIDPSSLVKYFEAPDHFQTYKLERDPSFSANANTLLALLKTPNRTDFVSQIEKALRFLVSCWESGDLRDKWNLAPEYSQMLLANVLLEVVAVWSEGQLADLVTSDIPIILCQLFLKIQNGQYENGSWDNSVERTAYSVLLLAYISRLPWPSSLREVVHTPLMRGREYLTRHADDWSEGDYIWIEKVTYRLPILTETYCLAAMKISTEETAWDSNVEKIFTIPDKKLETMSKFLVRLPMFRDTSPGTILWAIAEAYFYFLKLKTMRLEIFPRDNMGMTKDKYLEFIPMCWTTVNATTGFPLSGDIMWEMMIISMLNYQVDEYMESVVGCLPTSCLPELKYEIRAACLDEDISTADALDLHLTEIQNYELPPTPRMDIIQSQPPSPQLSGVVEVLRKYIKHIRHHRGFTASPAAAQKEVSEELNKFLYAHIAHNEDNLRLRETDAKFDSPLSSQLYFDWVKTTGANDTSCPYSFSFFNCLITGEDCPSRSSGRRRYFTRALGLHLATMCRQYNDYGSYSRDKEEKNLNSLDFADFNENVCRGSGPRKEDLMDIAEFERSVMQLCFKRLTSEVSQKVSAQIQAFINVTDLFGQIYVAQDIASRLKN
jgi:hypothetical protein